MRVRTFEERLEAARLGRVRHPFFLIVNFNTGYAGQSITGNTPSFEYAVPAFGAKFDIPLYALMTDAGSDSVYYDIIREKQTQDGYSIGRFFGNPQKLTLAAGSIVPGASRAVPAEWFYFPEPVIIREGEYLRMRANQAGYGAAGDTSAGALGPEQGSVTPASVDISNLRAVFLSELILKDDTEEGKLTEKEIEEITKQILTRKQRTFIEFIDIDFSVAAKYQGVTLPELDEWAVILGFASGTPTGAASNFLQYSSVAILDPNGKEWSNDSEPIPVAALCALPFDSSNKQVQYRELLTPLLVGPRRENLNFTFSQRSGLGTDTTGKIAVLMRTI